MMYEPFALGTRDESSRKLRQQGASTLTRLLRLAARPSILLMLGFLFTDAVSTALAQSSPAPVRTPPRRSDITPVSAETFDEFAEMLRGLERRVDILARQNEELLRENQRLSNRLNPSSFAVQKDRDPLEIPSQDFRVHQTERGLLEPSGPVPHPFHYDGTHRPTEFEHIGYTNPVGHHGEESPPAAGGGSKAAGGDPTTTGRA